MKTTYRKNKRGGILKATCVIFFLLLLLYAIAAYHKQEGIKEYKYFKADLQNFLAPEVVFNKVVYEIKSGEISPEDNLPVRKKTEILRLAHFAVATRIDPLFALEGVDPDSLHESVTSLKTSLEKLVRNYRGNEREILANTLYPIGFLFEVSSLEELRQQFIYEPTDELARQYHFQLNETIDSYLNKVSTLKNTLSSLKPRIMGNNFYFLDGYTTTRLLIEALEEVEKSAMYRKDNAKARWECYQGKLARCTSLLERQRISLSDTKPQEETFPRNENIRGTLANKLRILNSLYQFSNDTSPASSSPFFALSGSSCFPEIAPVYYSPQESHTRWGNTFMNLFLNDFYFFDTTSNSRNLFLENINKEGINLWYQPPTNMYLCFGAVVDTTKVATLHTLYQEITRNQLFETGTINYSESIQQLVQKLKTLEQLIRRGGVIYEQDVDIYIRELGNLLQQTGEVKLAQVLGEEKVIFIGHLLAIANQQSSQFDKLILEAIRLNNFVSQYNEVTGIAMSLKSIFISRSYPALFFLLENRTFSDKNAHFIINKPTVLEFFNLISYNETLQDSLSLQEIQAILSSKRNLIIKNQ